MKRFTILLTWLLSFIAPAKSQDYTWKDDYTYSTPVCGAFNSSQSGNIPLSLTHQSLQISGINPVTFPLSKTYRFDFFYVSGGMSSLVGSVTKNELSLDMPGDLQNLLPLMQTGSYQVFVTIQLQWMWQTPYTINYSGRLNGSQAFFKGNLEAPGNSTFSWSPGKVTCFDFVKCFRGGLTATVDQGYHRIRADVTGGSGNYLYRWVVLIDKANPGGRGCVAGNEVFSVTNTNNQISIPCSPCNYTVYCTVIDQNTNCSFQYSKTLLTCQPVDYDSIRPPVGRKMNIPAPQEKNNIRIQSLPGRQLQIEGLTPGSNKKLSIYNLEGMVLEQAATGAGARVRLPLYAVKKSGNYVVAIECNGVVIARTMIRIE